MVFRAKAAKKAKLCTPLGKLAGSAFASPASPLV